MMPPHRLSAVLKAHALRLGFSHTGIVPVAPSLTHTFYTEWLQRGYAGEMHYLHRHAALKRDPGLLSEGARALVMVALSYHTQPVAPPLDGEARGRVSRYAWGADYHEVLREKLEALGAFLNALLQQEAPNTPLRQRICVDSAPLMEREFAARAGLGWVGRNAMLIHPRHGSWWFLGGLLVDHPLPPDRPIPPRQGHNKRFALRPPPAERTEALRIAEYCGSCTACITVCPTEAIVADRTIDSRRCISYLTIEHKAAIPLALRPALGNWIFGCDLCQQVCPWNRHAPPSNEARFSGTTEQAWPSLPQLLALDDQAFRTRFRFSALWRTRRRGLLRNAAIALGNWLREGAAGHTASSPKSATHPRERAESSLRRSLQDVEPLVRGAAAWALGQMPCGRASQMANQKHLRHALARETDPEAAAEQQYAWNSLQNSPGNTSLR